MRTIQQKYWDAFAVLNLFRAANNIGSIDGNLKIQKMGFIVEERGQEQNLKAAHYPYFRYNNGPFSKDLANDVLRLKDMGFITRANQLTRRGSFLVEFVGLNADIKGRSLEALNIAENVAKEFGKHSGSQLTNIVYGMVVPVIGRDNERIQVKDIGHCTDIIDPLEDAQMAELELFSDDLIEDLKEEFKIPLEKLDPKNQQVHDHAVGAIEHALQSIA